MKFRGLFLLLLANYVVDSRSLTLYCKPTIVISDSNEAGYQCKGPGVPPRNLLQRINVEYTSQYELDSVYKFRATDNSLRVVPSIVFDRFRNLREVLLYNIQLAELRQDNLKNARALKKLNIQWNNINELQYRLFSNAPKLEILELSNNQIQFVHKDAFSVLNFIQRINLSGNSIIMMSALTFRSNPALMFIDLSNNDCISSRFRNGQDAEVGISSSDCNVNYRNKEIYFKRIYRHR